MSPRKKKNKVEQEIASNIETVEASAPVESEEVQTLEAAADTESLEPIFESETKEAEATDASETSETEVSENDLVAFAEQEGLIEEKEESLDNVDVSDFDLESEENQNLMASIETILFMSDKPISLAKIRSFVDRGINIKQYRKAMKALRSEFSRNFRGIDIVEVSGGFQLRTKPLMSAVLRKMVKTTPIRISTTAMETLAVIAYKQPIVKDEIDKIRGVDSGYMIRSLLEKRLVKIIGRSELPGKPMLYATSHEFLELFNLRDLESLPPLHEIEAMVATSEVGEEDAEEKAFENFSEIVDTQATTLFEEGGLDQQVEDLRSEIASIKTSTDYIEDQKRKEKIKTKLDARGLSDEARLELESELNELEAKYEPKSHEETLTTEIAQELIANDAATLVAESTSPSMNSEELVNDSIPTSESFDKDFLSLSEEKVQEAMQALETVQAQNSEALLQAFESMVATQNADSLNADHLQNETVNAEAIHTETVLTDEITKEKEPEIL